MGGRNPHQQYLHKSFRKTEMLLILTEEDEENFDKAEGSWTCGKNLEIIEKTRYSFLTKVIKTDNRANLIKLGTYMKTKNNSK